MPSFDGAVELVGLAEDPLTGLANVLLLLAALGCLTFAVLYTTRAAWRSAPLGRHMFYFAWAVVFAYAVGASRAVWPEQDWLDYLRLVSLSTVAFVFWQRVYLLWRSLHSKED